MRIRHEYNKKEAQKPLEEQESTKDCHCNTLVLIVDKTNKTVYRDHFNHCPSKTSRLNLEAPKELKGNRNWQVRFEMPAQARDDEPFVNRGYESTSSNGAA